MPPRPRYRGPGSEDDVPQTFSATGSTRPRSPPRLALLLPDRGHGAPAATGDVQVRSARARDGKRKHGSRGQQPGLPRGGWVNSRGVRRGRMRRRRCARQVVTCGRQLRTRNRNAVPVSIPGLRLRRLPLDHRLAGGRRISRRETRHARDNQLVAPNIFPPEVFRRRAPVSRIACLGNYLVEPCSQAVRILMVGLRPTSDATVEVLAYKPPCLILRRLGRPRPPARIPLGLNP